MQKEIKTLESERWLQDDMDEKRRRRMKRASGKLLMAVRESIAANRRVEKAYDELCRLARSSLDQ